jgi:hypothetical protein
MSTVDWHDHNEFLLNGVRFDTISLTGERTNAAFWVTEPDQDEKTVLTLGWGPYYVEIIVKGNMRWYLNGVRNTIMTVDDLDDNGLSTNRSINASFMSRNLIRDDSPYFLVKVEGITGRDEVVGKSHERLTQAFDYAHEVLTKWVAESLDPIPF